MLTARSFPENICSQLEGRLVSAGFVNQVVQIIPVALNHSGKAGKLFW
jgi:hypothetical protein